MPWENIGNCGSGQLPGDRSWTVLCYELAISYMDFVLGNPPDGCGLGIMWHEHDNGEYPTVGVHWDFPQSEPPWKYIRRCEIALTRFDESVEWFDISPGAIEGALEESELSETDWKVLGTRPWRL